MTRICTVCARGGSKGLPGKNIRRLAGKPLIVWTLEQAIAVGLFDLIVVSSDSCGILEVAGGYSADLMLVKRPRDLAGDSVAKLPAIKHALEEAEASLGRQAKVVVDLDVTSPLRVPEDIHGVVNMLESSGASNIITGAPARRSPYFNLVERDSMGVARLSKEPERAVVRRQDAPKCFDMNASIYAWRRDTFAPDPRVFYEDTRLYDMPEDRSVDIDSELDFNIVEMLLSRRGRNVSQ